MNTRTPKAARSKATTLRAARVSYSPLTADARTSEGGIERSTSSWHMPLISRDGPISEERNPSEHGTRTETLDQTTTQCMYPPPPSPPTPPTYHRKHDFPEELAQMIISMGSGTDKGPTCEELAGAFREASDRPPITKQSLSELDIQNIITNIRLRHDVNFDRDLSFRPNLDGAKGQQKRRTTDQYWKALEAELELYTRLFHGTPSPLDRNSSDWLQLAEHAKLRIPIVFRTIQEVLKSLVPDRDHARVDEHLDVPMLMQEIERGVCDQVRLAEWMAQLLKEHCAPMRDGLVDKMVDITREGVAARNSATIVEGLRQVLAILEAMKLDVANHQIRNLKTLLIDDTINFEKHYHLDQLVGHRSRVNIDTAQAWYLRATWQYVEQFPTSPRDIEPVQLEIMVRTVIAQLFDRDSRVEFPETFYLDQDRLRTLKAEIEDLVHIEVCIDAFATFLKQLGHNGSLSPAIRHQLHSALVAIMGDNLGYGARQWAINSEALSLEILRQAALVAGQALTYSYDTLAQANEQLLRMFYSSPSTHEPSLEAHLLHRVLTCADRNVKSTPMDLFNNLIPIPNSIPRPQPIHFPHLLTTDTSSSQHTLNLESTKWQDIGNRITHIILLHWRVWRSIAYILEDGHNRQSSPSATTSTSASPQAVHGTRSPPQTVEQDQQVVSTMQTGEPRESGQESQVVRQLPSR
ncbi:hypothetical protein EK21DRAFT_53941 [Setomelanomma holmii]|uniref:Tcp11-domain-containing protein n=1 Tax=Setomelanomma holmii TaxID=210430 RepID=A0A9P4HM93_9PLEO|nr:hypothetical protein EK21DRAFT_53941 [Setomelanomma holmii]